VLSGSDPTAVLLWLHTSAARQMLAGIGQAEQPPTHRTLDGYQPSRAREHLRKVLTVGGILAPRDEHLAGLERWITGILARVGDPAERRIVRSFATWHYLRRLRQKSERRYITAGQAGRARAGISNAVKLITWLHDHDRSLAGCTQREVDRWLAESPTTHRHAQAFLSWTSQHGHTHELEIPLPERNDKITRIDDDERWETVRRLLHDNTLALQDRVAGLLMLLYGQPLSRIARLRRDQLVETPAGVQLLLGDKPVDLPSPLEDLVRELAGNHHGHAVVGHTDEHPWLFPGGAPGHPISDSWLGARLRSLGVHGRAGRNTTLIDLAAQLPPTVLARMLGIHIITATAWSERAAGSRATYAAELARTEGSFSKI
jgi:hypothetical protein